MVKGQPQDFVCDLTEDALHSTASDAVGKDLWCWLTPSLVEQPQQNLTMATDSGLLLPNPGMSKKRDQVL